MWLKFDTLGQKKQQSPSKPKGVKVKSVKSVKPLKKTSEDLNLGNWRALHGLPNQETMKQLLLRVVNRVISLDPMFHEGEKIKKVLKVKNIFLQLSGQRDWKTCREMFPDETEGSILAAWIDKLNPEVHAHPFFCVVNSLICKHIDIPNPRSNTCLAPEHCVAECRERYPSCSPTLRCRMPGAIPVSLPDTALPNAESDTRLAPRHCVAEFRERYPSRSQT